MNKRQVFIRTLKAVVLIITVLVALPVYVQDACASYDVGNFSGGFAQGTTGGELWHTVTISHSGELVLNFTYTVMIGWSSISLWKPDTSGTITSCYLIAKSHTVNNLAPGTYYIQVKQSGYGTYTVQAVFTNADDNLTESEPNDTIDAAKLFTDNQVTGILGYTDYTQTDKEDWFRYEITRSGKLVLSLTNTGLNVCTVYLWKPDKSGTIALSNFYSTASSLTSDHLAPGTYYIQVKQYGGQYGTYTIQPAFKPDVSAPGLQDGIVCLRILSGIPVSSSEIIITDISKDGRIGMEECVYILQVVAGLRP